MPEHQAADSKTPSFLFVTCQVGAERALKAEIAQRWPKFHFAYSRGGFLTFKLPATSEASHDFDPDRFDLGCVFARSWGFSLGKVSGDLDDRVPGVWKLVGDGVYDALHVWQRDTARPGWRGFEPHVTPLAREAEAALRRQMPAPAETQDASYPSVARPGQRVLDCVIVEPDEWWIGWHRATTSESCYAGALREIALPPEATSRAYLKMEEALRWSALPIAAGQRVAEIGCAPGGASQALLDHGLIVMGIDPARVDPRVLAHRNFTHVHKRGDDVRRREFQGIAWLTADMNVAPDTTLEMLEAIVKHPTVNIRGLLITLKLLDWKMADQIPSYLERIRGWGYGTVTARQLTYNRQEICVAAQRGNARRGKKPAIRRKAARKNTGAEKPRR